MKIPEMAKTFNEILEYSGISPIFYSSKPIPFPMQMGQMALTTNQNSNGLPQ